MAAGSRSRCRPNRSGRAGNLTGTTRRALAAPSAESPLAGQRWGWQAQQTSLPWPVLTRSSLASRRWRAGERDCGRGYRLAAVGRTAVSNWRRRYADFPQPVGGTPASPLFALAEVEAWLRSQGKLLEVPLVERAWQELRARAGDDLQLAAALADAGDLLVKSQDSAPAAVRELAAALGAADAFEVLLRRFQEGQARRAAVTPPEIAELMAALTGGAQTGRDPACGTGELLLAARDHGGACRLLGQDAAADQARLAGIRFQLGGSDATVRTGDSLRRHAFPGVLADTVLCDPPFHERGWGHEELTADPRWIYGLPPRLEPELAWVQHGLAHLAPGWLAVMLMPAAAAARRPAAGSGRSCSAKEPSALSWRCPRRTISGCCGAPPVTHPRASSWSARLTPARSL